MQNKLQSTVKQSGNVGGKDFPQPNTKWKVAPFIFINFKAQPHKTLWGNIYQNHYQSKILSQYCNWLPLKLKAKFIEKRPWEIGSQLGNLCVSFTQSVSNSPYITVGVSYLETPPSNSLVGICSPAMLNISLIICPLMFMSNWELECKLSSEKEGKESELSHGIRAKLPTREKYNSSNYTHRHTHSSKFSLAMQTFCLQQETD